MARLEDGSLAAVTRAEFDVNRAAYNASRDGRKSLALLIERIGRHAVASLEGGAPAIADEPEVRTNIAFEMRLGAYLKETESWAPPDRPAPAERHFIRKKRRADIFEARNKTT